MFQSAIHPLEIYCGCYQGHNVITIDVLTDPTIPVLPWHNDYSTLHRRRISLRSGSRQIERLYIVKLGQNSSRISNETLTNVAPFIGQSLWTVAPDTSGRLTQPVHCEPPGHCLALIFGAAKAERAIDSTASVNQVEANAHMTRKGYGGVEREGGRDTDIDVQMRIYISQTTPPMHVPKSCIQ